EARPCSSLFSVLGRGRGLGGVYPPLWARWWPVAQVVCVAPEWSFCAAPGRLARGLPMGGRGPARSAWQARWPSGESFFIWPLGGNSGVTAYGRRVSWTRGGRPGLGPPVLQSRFVI